VISVRDLRRQPAVQLPDLAVLALQPADELVVAPVRGADQRHGGGRRTGRAAELLLQTSQHPVADAALDPERVHERCL
jgi:hypothetical protein